MHDNKINPISLGLSLLVLGLLSIEKIVPIPAIWIAVIFIIAFQLSKGFIRDREGFILTIFFLSHFSYADNQGGLWNITSLASIGLVLIIKPSFNIMNLHVNVVPKIFALLLLLLNIIGWIFISKATIILRIQGLIMMLSYATMFMIASSLSVSPHYIRRFYHVLSFTTVYSFCAAVNQRLGFVNTVLPILPPKSVVKGLIQLSTNADSVFGNSELYGEYSVLTLILYLSLTTRSGGFDSFLSKKILYSSIVLTLFGTLLSGSRSSIFLTVAVLLYYGLRGLGRGSFSISYSKFLVRLSLFLVLFFVLGFDLGIKSSGEDIESLSNVEFTIQGILDGRSINRYETFLHGFNRLSEQSWFFGAGIGPLESNMLAWWGNIEGIPYVDFHNLYLTLPMVYGYSGAIVFVSLILGVIYQGFRFRGNNDLSFLVNTLPIFWFSFLADEWKISMLRNPNYHMLIWIFLGLSYSIIKSSKRQTK